MKKRVIVLLLVVMVSTALAQAHWGQAQQLIMHSSGYFGMANPTFYMGDSLCIEYQTFDDIYCRLYGMQLYSVSEPYLIVNDSLNCDSVNNVSPFVTYDQTRLYFSSDRPGGYGGLDIWMSTWENESWSIPENLGPNINTDQDEFGASLPADNNTLYFTRTTDDWSGIPLTSGIIYASFYENDSWQQAEALPEPVNINDQAWEPSITADGERLYFCGRRPENPQHYFAYVTNKTDDQWSTPEALNDNINCLTWCPWDSSYGGDVMSFSIDSSGSMAVFTYWPGSDCPEVDIMMSEMIIDVDEKVSLPQDIEYYSYPNPFNGQVNISLSLCQQSHAEITIYDICGREVEKLYCGEMAAGWHNLVWSPDDLGSGIYFSRITTDRGVHSEKLIYLK